MPPLGGGDGSPGSVARATYAVEVAWTSDVVGLFTIGVSTIAGGDVLGTGLYDPSFTGPYDDVTAMLDRVTITRGRDDRLSFVQAGEATITLRDSDGMLNDRNPSSPLAGMLDDRLHPVRVVSRRDLYPGFESHFFGFVRRIVWQPNGRRGIAQLECVDAFYWLERTFPIIASMGPTTTGAAISAILDAASFPTSWRILDVGDAIPDFSADGTQNGLALIQGLLEAERGVFFSSGAGIATYRSRLSRLLEPTVGSIADSMTTLPPGVDFDEAKTRVTVRRTQNGYTAVATASSSPLSRYAYNDLELIETPYLSSDAQADSLANWILSQVATSRIPIYGLTIDNRESSLLDQILGRDLVDRITVSEAKLKTSGDYHIDSINHEIDVGGSGRHTTTYLLTKASTVNPFIIGTSVIGGSDVFVY